jgi:hypothetical protein
MLSPTIFMNYRLSKMEERDKNSTERKVDWTVAKKGLSCKEGTFYKAILYLSGLELYRTRLQKRVTYFGVNWRRGRERRRYISLFEIRGFSTQNQLE